VIIKMRTFNKIVLFGAVLFSLSFICSTFSCLTDTYAAFDDAKNVNVNITTASWDSKANLIELSDSKFPVKKEKLSEPTFTNMKNPKASTTGNNSAGENSSSNGSSVNDLMSDFSVEGNDTMNLTTNNLTLTDGNGKCSLDSSTVPEKPASVLPVANFNSNVTSGYAPLSVQFIDPSTNATKWNWDFGDGNTSTEQNPIHTYSSSWTNTVILTVSNTNGTDSKLGSITVLGKHAVVLPPVANFSSNFSRGFVPFSIQFADLSENATLLNWDFGDGNNSTEHSPVHTYSAPGSYTVTLAASNENGTNSTFSTMIVLQTVLPVANFSSNITSSYAPLSVQFTDLSDNATGWNWDFGDEVNSTQQNPMHTYSIAGNYTVNLIATNAAGKSKKIHLVSVDKKICNKRDFCKQKTQ
jgi:PKD repeat protein